MNNGCKGSSCKSNFKKLDYVDYKKNRKVKWKVSVINTASAGVPIASVKAKTVSLKKGSKGYVRYKTKVTAQIHSFVLYEIRANYGNCSPEDVGVNKSGKTASYNKKSEAKCRVGNSAIAFTIRNKTVSTYFYCDGWSKEYTLEWDE